MYKWSYRWRRILKTYDISGFVITQIISRDGKGWSLLEVKALDEEMATEFDGYRNNYDYKVCEIGWLL